MAEGPGVNSLIMHMPKAVMPFEKIETLNPYGVSIAAMAESMPQVNIPPKKTRAIEQTTKSSEDMEALQAFAEKRLRLKNELKNLNYLLYLNQEMEQKQQGSVVNIAV
jgi:hypothetical protein